MKSQAALTLLLLTSLATSAGRGDTYEERIGKWRVEQAKSLLRERGWLSVAGLFWLKEGANTFGSSARSDLRFPPSAPPEIGVLTRRGNEVSLKTSQPVNVNGEPVTEKVLQSDADRIVVGSLTFTVIKRGERIGVRLYDLNRKERREFRGLDWYPVDPALVVRARFVPHNPPKQLPITNVLGDTAPVPNPGYVEFTLHGKKNRLEAQDAGNGLFFNFRDLTSGKETYPAGRFLDTAKPKDGWVTLDFNQATNPPCAYTEFATCPLPPRANYLSVSIKAGEKTYRARH